MKIIRVLYVGSGLAGRTTNLEVLIKTLKQKYGCKTEFSNEKYRSSLVCLKLYAELAVSKEAVALEILVWSCCIGNGVYLTEEKQQVLTSVDGIVYVIDSTLNIDYIKKDWEEFLRCNSARVPVVVQCNKQDFAIARNSNQLRKDLNISSMINCYEAIAVLGAGVFSTFIGLLSKIANTEDFIRSKVVEEILEQEVLLLAKEKKQNRKM